MQAPMCLYVRGTEFNTKRSDLGSVSVSSYGSSSLKLKIKFNRLMKPKFIKFILYNVIVVSALTTSFGKLPYSKY